jgi:hypothetical protein
MKNLAISLAVGASALFTTAAFAAPLSGDVSIPQDSNIQNVRMVIINEPRDSYGYAPRERYIEHRGYDDRGGVGFHAPGVSAGVGIGADHY